MILFDIALYARYTHKQVCMYIITHYIITYSTEIGQRLLLQVKLAHIKPLVNFVLLTPGFNKKNVATEETSVVKCGWGVMWRWRWGTRRLVPYVCQETADLSPIIMNDVNLRRDMDV